MSNPLSDLMQSVSGKPINKKIEDHVETVREFQEKIALAQANHDEWVETSPEIVKHFNPRGMNGAEYFIFGSPGVKVTEYGKAERIQERENEQMETRNFGKDAGVLEGKR